MKVENLTSSNGNKIANQFRIERRGEIFFQSYESIIVKIDKKGRVFLDKVYWDFSNTTRKYRNIFLRENSSEIKEKIKSGIYKLTNLNK